MKISGCTIARQAVTLGYPLAESIRSLLPLVDEYIVGVGDGDDGTWGAVQAIGDPRVNAFRSEWDLSRRGGHVIAEQTNKAIDRCTGDWIVYLQADEVLHERDLPRLRADLERHLTGSVESLSFRYLHFYGSFAFVQDNPARWRRRATRAVRNGIGARSFADGCAFVIGDGDSRRKPRGARSPVRVHHYGWARPPELMLTKPMGFARRYPDFGNLRWFDGEHPAVMRDRVAAADWPFDPQINQQWPDWIRRSHVYSRWLIGRLI